MSVGKRVWLVEFRKKKKKKGKKGRSWVKE